MQVDSPEMRLGSLTGLGWAPKVSYVRHGQLTFAPPVNILMLQLGGVLFHFAPGHQVPI